MKVVLFCGGLGLRMRDYSESIPKPMVPIGYRPILWHVMKFYAHFGYKDFILCLGHRADLIKEYFLNYQETLTNDFVMTGGKQVELITSDIHDWKITFADTGLQSNIAQRLLAVRPYLEGEEVFLANYSDGLLDIDLKAYVERAVASGKIASFVSVRPNVTFHYVSADDDGTVRDIRSSQESDNWQNAGYFVFRKEIFEYIRPGEELVNEPFHRLIQLGQLVTYKHHGFWACMDTYKEMQALNDMYSRGDAPWELWKRGSQPARNALTHP